MNAGKFSYYDLGQLQSGQFVELTLKGNAANVRLMDRTNFNNYKNGKEHRYCGGLATCSPIRFQIPQTTHWYLTIDFQGLSGKVEHSVKILPKPLPEIREGILDLLRKYPEDLQFPNEIRKPNPKKRHGIQTAHRCNARPFS